MTRFVEACRNSIGMTGKDSFSVLIAENRKMIRIFDEGTNRELSFCFKHT